MNFSCEKCGKKYSLSDDKIGDRGAKIRCKQCQHMIVLSPLSQDPSEDSTRMVSLEELARGGVASRSAARELGASATAVTDPTGGWNGRAKSSQGVPLADWEVEATRAVAAPDPSTQWYAMVRGQQVGPMDLRALTELAKTGEVTLKTFLWRETMEDWKRAEELAELVVVFAGPGVANPHAPAPLPAARVPAPLGEDEVLVTGFDLAVDPNGVPISRANIQVPARLAPARQPSALPNLAPELGSSPGWGSPVSSELGTPPGLESAPMLGSAPDLGSAPALGSAPGFAPGPPGDLGSDLFGDLNLRSSAEIKPLSFDDGKKKKGAKAPDPFGQMGKAAGNALPKPGENTSFIIAQAGVNKRNPPWKIALFILGLIGLPVGVVYGLSELNVVPLQITHVDPRTGKTVTDSVFSAGGASGLKDLLMGHKGADPAGAGKPDSPGRDRDGREARDKDKDKDKGKGSGPVGDARVKQLADLYQDTKKKDVGPKGAEEESAKEPESPGGPPEAEIEKAMQLVQPALKACLDRELKKFPSFKSGKVILIATVGTSGVVKDATIDRPDVNGTSLGECLKSRAKKMSFSKFAGEDVNLEIPLILTSSL